MRWQKILRLVIAGAAVAFAGVVALQFKRTAPPPPFRAPVRTDPGAVVEVTGGRVGRFKFSREDIRVDCERQLVYADGSTKLLGVTIATDERTDGRAFTVTGKEGIAGQNASEMVLNGDVRLTSSDGVTVRTEHASFSDKDNVVRATGPVDFSRGRMTGSGIGMTYETAADVLTILEQAVVHVAPDEHGAGAIEIVSGAATFARRDHNVHFDGAVRLKRAGQTVEADAVVLTLSEDEKQIETMELRGHSRIAMDRPATGGLQGLTSRDMDLAYAPDGQTLQHAVLIGDAAIVLAGTGGASGRQIAAKTMDIALAPDGVTPLALIANEAVQLVLPAEANLPGRTVRSTNMRAEGEAGRGLTHAEFTGAVEYGERGAGVNRTATSTVLDVALKPAMAGIEEAKFAHAVRFVDGAMSAAAAAARYNLDKGTLELTGSEPGSVRPRVVNNQISVDAARVDLTLAGPVLKAAGTVRSVLQAAKGARAGGAATETHVPSMLKGDKPVNVTADGLDYDGAASKATYTGQAQLWQDETSVKGPSIVLDNKSGDLTASGGVATVTLMDEPDKDNKLQRFRSVATAKDFRYEDAVHRATYDGGAHLTSPDGDVKASKIELYLKASGNELERMEAYEAVTLRDESRTTTGIRMTYTTTDQRYVVAGTPVKVLDECHRETTGKTLTYLKMSDTITMDGNEQTRTQTKGNGVCP